MSWIRFIAGFSRHPKRLKSGPISSWLWICSVDHCMTYLTDGFLDDAAVPGLCPVIVGPALKRAVENLVACGSWERVEGGYHVHGYLEHNLSRAQIEADRAAGRERYQTWKSRQVRTRDLPPEPPPNAVATPLQTPPQRRSNAVTTPLDHVDKDVDDAVDIAEAGQAPIVKTDSSGVRAASSSRRATVAPASNLKHKGNRFTAMRRD